MLKPSSVEKKMVEMRSKRAIRFGFALVMMVVCFIVLFGIQRLTTVKEILSSIVTHEQVAIEMLFRMQQSARDRSVLLYSVAATADPFERDELLLQHGKLGVDFNQAREALTMLQLDAAEVELLDSINAYVNRTRIIQGEVIDELSLGHLQGGQDLLNKQAVPSQNLVVGAINAFLQYEINKSHSLDQNLRDHQLNAQMLMLLAGVVALSFVVLIYIFISRRMGMMILGLAETARSLEESNNSLEAFRSAMDHHSIVSITDIRGDITFVNDRFCEISQYKKDELIGRNHRILNSAVHSHAFFVEMWSTISSGKIWQGEICNRNKSGQFYWVASTIVPFLDESGRPYKYISIRTEITSIKAAEQILIRDKFELERLVQERTAELQRLASTDVLTGIFNRRRFNEVLQNEIARAKRYDTNLTLIIFDIDHFKRINDHYGHQIGDEVLQELAVLVSRNIRNVDIFSRWGGEEFTILITDYEVVAPNMLAEKLKEVIADHAFAEVGTVTCSFGVTEYRAGDDLKSFINRADVNLYRAKGEGRNRVCFD